MRLLSWRMGMRLISWRMGMRPLPYSSLWSRISPPGNETAADHFNRSLQDRQAAFDSVFWNETEGLWLDWDLDRQAHLDGFYASSLLPLLWGCSSSAPNVTRHRMVLSRYIAGTAPRHALSIEVDIYFILPLVSFPDSAPQLVVFARCKKWLSVCVLQATEAGVDAWEWNHILILRG